MSYAKHTITDNLYIFLALLRRDLKILQKSLRAKLIDSLFILIPEIITFGYLFPLLGMPAKFIPSLFIGAGFIFILFILGYSFVMPIAHALPHNHIFHYQLTLPLPKQWLLAEYVTYFIINTALIATPLISIGVIILGPKFAIIKTHWPTFIGLYLLTLILFATLFLSTCFIYEFTWFKNNLWPRRLGPMLNFSTILFTWSAVKKFSPFISKLLLLNPITYVTEGLRASLLGGHEHLSLTFCIPAIFFWIFFYSWQLWHGLHKMLDPV